MCRTYLAEISLNEWSVELEWDFRMQIGFLDNVGKIGCVLNHSEDIRWCG